MFALQQLRTTLARNTAVFQAARGVAKKAVPPPFESLGQKWAVELIAQETAAEKTFKALLKGIEGAVVKGDKVLFTGFGSFEKVVRSARAGRNIQTGEAVTYPASNVRAKTMLGWKMEECPYAEAVKFKAGASFKNAVKGV